LVTAESKKLSDLMGDYIKEAVDLRYSATRPGVGADQSELLVALQDYRQRLDRIEELMVRAFLKKGAAYRNSKNLQDVAQDKWDESLTQTTAAKKSSLLQSQEFIAPKEKYAAANLATFDQRRALRQAEDDLSWAETASDVLLKMYRGLDSGRQDLLARIKAIPMVTSMEYTTS
jgi:hypothetical protein